MSAEISGPAMSQAQEMPGTIRLLAPGTTAEWFCGGLLTIQRLAAVVGAARPATVVTYRQREPELPFLDDLMAGPSIDSDVFVAAWGPDVAGLVSRLEGRRVCYWANSFGWGYRPPSEVPILSASRFTMGLWAEVSPTSPLFYLPNPLSAEFTDERQRRDIDVLHVGRKSSAYVRADLLPALSDVCHVVDVRDHVDDLAALFKRAKVYLYDSRDFWVEQGVSEGFGLQPLEAMACGCTVFSSVNAGLSDFVDPGVTAEKIGVHSLANDVARIVGRLKEPLQLSPEVFEPYRPAAVRGRWLRLEPLIAEHFEQTLGTAPDVTYRQIGAERRYQARRRSIGQRGISRVKQVAKARLDRRH